MNNAELTLVLALTDALLAAGWCQGQDERWRYEEVSYPTQHCLVGAVRVAVEEVADYWEQAVQGRAVALELLAAGVPERCSCCPPREVIVGYNDQGGRTVAAVRALVHAAAERLTK